MVFSTAPDIIAPDLSYSVIPFIKIGPSTDLRLGVAAGIDERTYNTGGGDVNPTITTVDLLLTDSMGLTSPKIVSNRSAWVPSTIDGGADTGYWVVDWNATWTAAELAALTDGQATVVATVNRSDGLPSKVMSAWDFYLDTANAITPTIRRVRVGGDDVTGDGSVGAPLATIARAVELSDGDNFDIIDLEAGQSTSIVPYNDQNTAGFGWITVDCGSGTHTFSGVHGSSEGFGSHKRWKLGPGMTLVTCRPGIDNGQTGGFWWLDGCDWSDVSQTGTTPFSTNGVHPSRYERWYATGLEIHNHAEFNTGPTMARGVRQYNFAGDSFLKASRDKNMTAYCTHMHDIIQSGGTHSDIMQINDSVTLDDVGTDHFIQSLLVNDSEAATMQLSNENNVLNFWDRAIIENMMLDNDGLQGNIPDVNGFTNNNLMRRMRNILWRHCGWRDQTQRLSPVDWDHCQWQGCYMDSIISDASAGGGGTGGDQTDLDNSGTTMDRCAYVSLTGFTSMPGTNQLTGTEVTWTTTDDSLDAFSQDYTLTAGSVGKGVFTEQGYGGRPLGETDLGPWPNVATRDFTIAPRMDGATGGGGNLRDLAGRMSMTLGAGL